MSKRIIIPRELLLVEVERWCGDHACNARTRLSPTKAEARAYTGFECSRCERWNEDALTERDIPEWWEGLKVGALEGLKPPPGAEDDPGELVTRMSDAWKGPGEAEEFVDEEEEGGDTF